MCVLPFGCRRVEIGINIVTTWVRVDGSVRSPSLATSPHNPLWLSTFNINILPRQVIIVLQSGKRLEIICRGAIAKRERERVCVCMCVYVCVECPMGKPAAPQIAKLCCYPVELEHAYRLGPGRTLTITRYIDDFWCAFTSSVFRG